MDINHRLTLNHKAILMVTNYCLKLQEVSRLRELQSKQNSTHIKLNFQTDQRSTLSPTPVHTKQQSNSTFESTEKETNCYLFSLQINYILSLAFVALFAVILLYLEVPRLKSGCFILPYLSDTWLTCRRPCITEFRLCVTLDISFFCYQSLDARIIIGEFDYIGARNVFCEVSSRKYWSRFLS